MAGESKVECTPLWKQTCDAAMDLVAEDSCLLNVFADIAEVRLRT